MCIRMGFVRGMLAAESIKLRRSGLWLLVGVSPLFAALVGYMTLRSAEDAGEFSWLYLASATAYAHGLLFLPLLAGLFAAFVCRFEHDGGGWKQLLALPVRRTGVYFAKLVVVVLLLAAVQAVYLAGIIIAGKAAGLSSMPPMELLFRCSAGGLLAALPLAALQLAVSVGWANFAAPLAINVMLTLPNILVINSDVYGPYYPWAQPIITMMPMTADSFGALGTPLLKLMLVIGAGFLLFFSSGLTYFRRKDM